MIYRDFKGEKLSALGFGTMRLPTADGKEDSIDEAKTRAMVELIRQYGLPVWVMEPLRGGKLAAMEDKYAAEIAALTGIADKMICETALPCTGCRYCAAKCPKGLDIPMLIEHYNEHVYSQGGLRAPLWLASIPADKQPSACIGCRSCEQVCPQEIKISEAMKDFVERLQVVKEGEAYGVKPMEGSKA